MRRTLLQTVPPGEDVDAEGEGDILRIVARPQTGERTIQMDADNFTITDEDMAQLPRSYTIEQYGYQPHEAGAELRRWARSSMDAEDSRHPEAI